MIQEIQEKITAKDMEKFLASRYCDSLQWVFLTQVRSSTGSADRIADAMAFNMYGSTGYEILGFEIKVSRPDWLSEMKQMSKSNEIMSYCDKWYLVVSDPKIVQEGELPKNWGLLVLQGGRLVQKVRATAHAPSPMPMHFIASILRRGGQEVERIRSQYIKKEDITGQIEEARKKGYEEARGYNGRHTEEALKTLRDQVDAFEKASGLTMESWRGKEYPRSLGMFVKFAMSLSEDSLDYHIRSIEQAISTLQRGIVDVKKIKTALGKE